MKHCVVSSYLCYCLCASETLCVNMLTFLHSEFIDSCCWMSGCKVAVMILSLLFYWESWVNSPPTKHQTCNSTINEKCSNVTFRSLLVLKTNHLLNQLWKTKWFKRQKCKFSSSQAWNRQIFQFPEYSSYTLSMHPGDHFVMCYSNSTTQVCWTVWVISTSVTFLLPRTDLNYPL